LPVEPQHSNPAMFHLQQFTHSMRLTASTCAWSLCAALCTPLDILRMLHMYALCIHVVAMCCCSCADVTSC
jgi:hypothetical protein